MFLFLRGCGTDLLLVRLGSPCNQPCLSYHIGIILQIDILCWVFSRVLIDNPAIDFCVRFLCGIFLFMLCVGILCRDSVLDFLLVLCVRIMCRDSVWDFFVCALCGISLFQ